jgi:hypothetical protein
VALFIPGIILRSSTLGRATSESLIDRIQIDVYALHCTYTATSRAGQKIQGVVGWYSDNVLQYSATPMPRFEYGVYRLKLYGILRLYTPGRMHAQ